MHFLKEEDSPGEAGRRLCVIQLCLFQNGAGPSLGVLWLVLLLLFFAEFGFIVQLPSPGCEGVVERAMKRA